MRAQPTRISGSVELFCGVRRTTIVPEALTVPFAISRPRRRKCGNKEDSVFHYAMMFFVVGVVAAMFGFSNIPVTTAEVVRVVFLICCAAFVFLPITQVMRRR
jgi:uncharacterized membrane protein YtjA (UPF0391 family)